MRHRIQEFDYAETAVRARALGHPDCAGIHVDRYVHGRASDADGGDRGLDQHAAGRRDLTRDEGERPLHQGENHQIRRAVRFVDEFVEDHPRVGGKREHRLVLERDDQLRVRPGPDDVVLKYRIADAELDHRAVGARGLGGARQGFDLADGLGPFGRAGLGVLPRRARADEHGHEVGRQHRAERRKQHRRHVEREVALDQEDGAVLAGQQQIVADPAELGREQQMRVGNDDRSAARLDRRKRRTRASPVDDLPAHHDLTCLPDPIRATCIPSGPVSLTSAGFEPYIAVLAVSPS